VSFCGPAWRAARAGVQEPSNSRSSAAWLITTEPRLWPTACSAITSPGWYEGDATIFEAASTTAPVMDQPATVVIPGWGRTLYRSQWNGMFTS
jgi:hypothetical protein